VRRHGQQERRGATQKKILDVGTGTGVLAIAAAKAFRCAVLASDIDAAAVRVARENARENGAAPLIEFICAAGVSQRRFRERGRYDLIFANILLGPLKGLARPIAGLIAPGGRVVLSGLLAAQANTALSVYRARGLRLQRRITLEGWTTLILVSG
jgi:ribosomal protein L11 methyltransferase